MKRINSKELCRHSGALTRLKLQLKSGKKTKKGSFNEFIELTDRDVSRIKREIAILESRIPRTELQTVPNTKI